MYQEAASNPRDYEAKTARPEGSYSSELADTKQSVERLSNQLRGLADAIRGPRPEPAGTNAQGIAGQRSLKDALDNVPGEIREICGRAEKQIEEIRAMLRV